LRQAPRAHRNLFFYCPPARQQKQISYPLHAIRATSGRRRASHLEHVFLCRNASVSGPPARAEARNRKGGPPHEVGRRFNRAVELSWKGCGIVFSPTALTITLSSADPSRESRPGLDRAISCQQTAHPVLPADAARLGFGMVYNRYPGLACQRSKAWNLGGIMSHEASRLPSTRKTLS